MPEIDFVILLFFKVVFKSNLKKCGNILFQKFIQQLLQSYISTISFSWEKINPCAHELIVYLTQRKMPIHF